MSNTPREYSPAEVAKMRETVARLGNRSKAALELDLPRTTIVRYTRDLMGSPMGGGFNPLHAGKHPERFSGVAELAEMGERLAVGAVRPGREPVTVTPMVVDQPKACEVKPPDFDKMGNAIRKRALNPDELAEIGKTTRGAVIDWLDGLKTEGFNVREIAGKFSIESCSPEAYLGGPSLEIVSDDNNRFRIGATGDSHLCSKYERLDCLNRLYDRYAEDGITQVLHSGNWIDGEARFNKFDLLVHGMDAQCRYLAEHYPRRDGMDTYAIAGDDHEGWYAQREGVNIGEYAENAMKKAGRTDWHDLGYMEAHVKLTNANTGKSAVLALVHPGGGSAYALSYTMQKLVESYEGGEKPAVLVLGHYHKLMAANIRNVWAIQTGCFQDQTPFMRKKRLEAHVGGVILNLKQDPETGAIVECEPNIIRYFNQAYYSNRWSHSGAVVLPDRS